MFVIAVFVIAVFFYLFVSLEFQIIRFVISIFAPIFIEISFVLPPIRLASRDLKRTPCGPVKCLGKSATTAALTRVGSVGSVGSVNADV